ncbi:MAG: hypothetical protein ACI9TH_004448 [Kiritimatiellia bacterium]|jgi:hypothetical protein
MEKFILQLKHFVYFVTLQPASYEELLIRLIVGLFACTAMLVLTAHLFRMSFPSFTSAFMITVVSGGLLIVLAALGHIYFKRAAIFAGIQSDHFTLGIFCLASLLIVVPLIRSTWCGSYISSAVCWGSALTVFVLSSIATGGVLNEQKAGKNIVSKQRQFTQSVQNLFEDNFPFPADRK